MSASKDKKLRKQQIEAGTDKRTIAAEKERKQHRKTTITYSVVAVALVIFFAFIFTYNSTFPSRHTTAVTVGDRDYSVAEMNFYYSNAYMNFYNNNYYYVSMGVLFDPNTSLAEQQYSEDMTWRDFFLESAEENMRQVQMLNDQAEAAGFELPAEYEDEYNAAMDDMVNGWQDLGYSSLKQYINLNYGKGVDEEMVRTETRKLYVASAYAESMTDSYEYTADELDDYYAENAGEWDEFEYAYYTIPADSELDGAAMAEAIDGTDVDEFTAYLAENTAAEETEPAEDAEAADDAAAAEETEAAEPAEPTVETQVGSYLSVDYGDWLRDEARAAGDATYVEGEVENYVVMFLSRNDNSYPMANFRHILINAEDADGDGVSTEEEIAAAAEEAQGVYDDWQAGDATEDSFAEMANELSDDAGSNTNGGLYENVFQGQMVEPINDWLFADGRKAGDTTVVSYEGANYTGTHVVYYVGESDLTYAQYQADTAMRTEAYNSWLEENLENYQATLGHTRMVGKNH